MKTNQNSKRSNRIRSRSSTWLKLIWAYSLLFGASRREHYIAAGKKWVSFMEHMSIHSGEKMACAIGKVMFGVAKRVLFGYKDGFIAYPVWTKCDRENLPRSLRSLARLLKGSRSDRLFAISVFALYLMIRLRATWDFTSLEDPYTGRPLSNSFIRYLHEVFVPWVREKMPKTVRRPKDLFLVKTGAWSLPAVLSAATDAFVLLDANRQRKPWALGVFGLIQQFGSYEASATLFHRLERLAVKSNIWSNWVGNRASPDYANPRPGRDRSLRTSVTPDRGGKTRMFTAGSYWIQYALYPIHDYFMNTLRNIREDYTYRQDEAVQTLKGWQRKGLPVYSFDLTSATDRFPLAPQTLLLGLLLGHLVADYWTRIMTHWSLVNDKLENASGKIWTRYRVGQPMGLYSSWPVFTLCHHAVVRYCAWQAGVDPEGLYAILGDDVSIANEAIATRYHRFVTQDLGVAISLPKSYIPNISKGIHPSEFAKQLVSHGKCYTPITPDLVEDIDGYNWPNLVILLRHFSAKWGMRVDAVDTDLPRLVKRLVRPTKHRKALRYVAYLQPDLLSKAHWRKFKDWGMFNCDNQPWFGQDFKEGGLWHETALKYESYRLIERLKVSLYSDEFFLPLIPWMDQVSEIQDDESLSSLFDSNPIYDEPIARLTLRALWKLTQAATWQSLETAEIHVTLIREIIDRQRKSWQSTDELKQKIGAARAGRYVSHYRLHARTVFNSTRVHADIYWIPSRLVGAKPEIVEYRNWLLREMSSRFVETPKLSSGPWGRHTNKPHKSWVRTPGWMPRPDF